MTEQWTVEHLQEDTEIVRPLCVSLVDSAPLQLMTHDFDSLSYTPLVAVIALGLLADYLLWLRSVLLWALTEVFKQIWMTITASDIGPSTADDAVVETVSSIL